MSNKKPKTLKASIYAELRRFGPVVTTALALVFFLMAAFDGLQVAIVFVATAAGIVVAVPVAIFAMVYFPTLIHEIGHLLAGAAVGFRPTGIQVGSLNFTETESGWRFGWRKIASGGLAMALPTHFRNLRWRTAFFVAGGVLGDFLVLSAGWLLSRTEPELFRWLFIVWISAAAGLIQSIYPNDYGANITDGLFLQRLVKLDAEGKRSLVQYAMAGMDRVKACGTDPETLARLNGELRQVVFEMGHSGVLEWSNYVEARTEEDRLAALESLRKLLENEETEPGSSRMANPEWYRICAAYGYAMKGRNVELARRFLPESVRPDYEPWWIQAGVLVHLVSNEAEAALALLDRWDELAKLDRDEAARPRIDEPNDQDPEASAIDSLDEWMQMARKSALRQLERRNGNA